MNTVQNKQTVDPIEAEWIEIFNSAPNAIRAAARDAVADRAGDMASTFYARMQADPEAAVFLTHAMVHDRLLSAMSQWIKSLFSCSDAEAFVKVMERQREVGNVHARIDLPIYLVARGARLIKGEIAHALSESTLDRQTLVHAVLYVDNLLDLAFEVMSAAFVKSHERVARADEAYRVFSHSQNMSLERERQRAALLEWENELLQEMLSGSSANLEDFSGSAVGLWLQHKATAIFDGCAELPAIMESMHKLDDDLIPQCRVLLERAPNPSHARSALKAVQSEISRLKFLLSAIFDRYVDLESGKDALTQLLNRRFLPPILQRETEFARSHQRSFAVMLIDIDHFKAINDAHGHKAGDQVLKQTASLLQDSIRAGDFVFRYGGEEFLIVLVEVDERHALRVGEKIRTYVQGETLRLDSGSEQKLTVSIGIAMFDGHPDTQTLINRADSAMYRAKQSGRNCCVIDARSSSKA